MSSNTDCNRNSNSNFETVTVTLTLIEARVQAESFMVSPAANPNHIACFMFGTEPSLLSERVWGSGSGLGDG